MKNLFKARIAPLIGIIALAAVMVFSLVGCDQVTDALTGGGLKTLSGNVTVSPSVNVTTGTELTAAYSGKENVTLSWQWKKDGKDIPGETLVKYTPASAGNNYTVTASASGYHSKSSTTVIVTGPTLAILSGTVSITPKDGVTTGTELTAAYSGSEEVALSYQWNKDGVAIPDETGSTYTPIAAGAYTVTIKGDGYLGKTSASVTVSNRTPIAADYDIGNLGQIAGSVTPVTITPQAGKSGGAIAIFYDGSSTIPQTAGTYALTFNVAAATGWNAASGLSAGTLTVIALPKYIITKEDTTYTAKKDDETISSDINIQTVINAIRDDANGENISVQFGASEDVEDGLDIGTASVEFTNNGDAWGLIVLAGGITADAANTVTIGDGVSIVSRAFIDNTNNDIQSSALRKDGAGTVAISGGTVAAESGIAVRNSGAGTLTISGGTISAPWNYAVQNAADGTLNISDVTISTTGYGVQNGGTAAISGGTISVTTNIAVQNAAGGTLNISGGAISATGTGSRAINNAGSVTISGGEISTTVSFGVRNDTGGTLNISGGTISATGTGGRAVYNNGTTTISGGTISATRSYAVNNSTNSTLNISGGTISATTTNNAVGNSGTLHISGGTISATEGSAVSSSEVVNISGGDISATTGDAVSSWDSVNISGGTISATTGRAIYIDNAGNFPINLSGNPTITGRICPVSEGNVVVTNNPPFTPGSKVYTLDFWRYTEGMVAVTGGADFVDNFRLYEHEQDGLTYALKINGNNLVASSVKEDPIAAHFMIWGATTFTYDGNPQTVNITRSQPGGSYGNVTFYYNGDTTPPTNPGTYTVTLDITACPGWNAAYGLIIGTFTIIPATPIVGDFEIGKLNQPAGNVTAVTITPKAGKSTGAINVQYEGISPTSYPKSATVPQAVGTYAVTFDVAAVTGWNAATGLIAGTLTVRVSGTVWTAVSATESTFNTRIINGIVYGGGTWIAGGTSGRIAYSTNGSTWTAVSSSTFGLDSIDNVAYGNDRFVAVGGSGKIAYSTNGTSWTAVSATDSTFGISGNIYAITYGGGKFVAVGQTGKMAYSTNGSTWTAVSDSTFGVSVINGIAYGNGKFVAVGTHGKMAYSANGETWTAVSDSTFGTSINGTSDINGIAYGNGRFVAGGTDGKMAYSANGETWTAVSDSTFGTSINGIAYGGGTWVAGGTNGKMAYSANGETWTAVSDSTFGTSVIYCIAYGNGRFVAGGGGGRMAYSE